MIATIFFFRSQYEAFLSMIFSLLFFLPPMISGAVNFFLGLISSKQAEEQNNEPISLEGINLSKL